MGTRKQKPPPKKTPRVPKRTPVTESSSVDLQKATREVNEFGKVTGVTSADIVSVSQREGRNRDWLRRLAGIHYTTSLEGISIRAMSEDPIFSSVAEETLEHWSMRDGWVARRNQYYDGIEAQTRRQIGEEQLKATIEQVKDLEAIAGKIHTKLSNDEVDPGTYEGMAGALLKVVGMINDMRTKIASTLGPVAGEDQAPVDARIVPKLSAEEAFAGAHAILELRKAEMAKLMDAKEEPDAEEEVEESVEE